MNRHVAITAGIVVLSWSASAPAQHETHNMPDSSASPANRLIDSLSPYLLQHAHNPVDWYPWGAEALGKAREENKPIFLSIGYSACHWCHVMAHECFEQRDVGALLNRHFVNIKVDREERPDIDEIYMQATMAMNQGSGGWPMSVFLTPDCVPFWAGTYIPKEPFMKLVQDIAAAWEREPDNIRRVAEQMHTYLRQWGEGPQAAAGLPEPDIRERTARSLAQAFDLEWGGLRGSAHSRNKFPPSMDAGLLVPVEVTLDKMANGGIYDHLGGGICRYSTDPYWLVPHFEKMLYDQALVSSIYLDGVVVFNNPRYAEVARGILDYVITDLQSPQGGFYSTRDADSEGLEGKYYVWRLEEVQAALGEEDAKLFCAYYDVTAQGNWDEPYGHAPPGPKNILNIKHELGKVAREAGLSEPELAKRLADMRARLLAVRAQRVAPGLDDKILTAWNGLVIASLAKGARVLDEPRYAQAAVRAAEFLLSELRRDGRLLRTHRQGQSRLTAYLDDYAFVIEGLLNLYEATFDGRWLREAEALADVCHRYYYDPAGGGFFFTAGDAETLITRTKSPTDGAIPSGNSIHAMNLLRLAVLLDRKEFRSQAESIFRAFGALLQSSPWSCERMLCALDFYYAKPKEIVLAAARRQDLASLVRTVYGRYLPNKVVAAVASSNDGADMLLLKGKVPLEGRPTAYVCENYICKRPVHSERELEKLLWPAPAAD